MTKDDLFAMVDGEDERKDNNSKGILKDNTMPIPSQRRVSFAPEVTLHKFKNVEYPQSKRRRTVGYQVDESPHIIERTDSFLNNQDVTDQPKLLQDSSDEEEFERKDVVVNSLQSAMTYDSDDEERTMELTGQIKLSPRPAENLYQEDDEEQTMDLTGQIKLSPRKLDYKPSPRYNDNERIMELSGRLTLSPKNNNEIRTFTLSNIQPENPKEIESFGGLIGQAENSEINKIAHPDEGPEQNEDEGEEETMELTGQIAQIQKPTLQEISDPTDIQGKDQPPSENIVQKLFPIYSNLTDISEEDLQILRNEEEDEKKLHEETEQKEATFPSSVHDLEAGDMELTQVPRLSFSSHQTFTQIINENLADFENISMNITENLSRTTHYQKSSPKPEGSPRQTIEQEPANNIPTNEVSDFANADQKSAQPNAPKVSDDTDHDVEVTMDFTNVRPFTEEEPKNEITKEREDMTMDMTMVQPFTIEKPSSTKEREDMTMDITMVQPFTIEKPSTTISSGTGQRSNVEENTADQNTPIIDMAADFTTLKPLVSTNKSENAEGENIIPGNDDQKDSQKGTVNDHKYDIEQEITPVLNFLTVSADEDVPSQNQASQPMDLTQESRIDTIESYGDTSENNIEDVSTTMIPLAEISTTEVVNEDYSPVTLKEFMEDIHVNFYDDLDMGKSYRASISNFNLNHTLGLHDYAKAIPKLELLALYEFSCAELKKNIDDGRKVFDSYNQTIIVNNPPLFNDYYSLDYDARLDMNLKFQQLKDYTRFQSREDWYTWRKQLTSNLINELNDKQSNFSDDGKNLDQAVSRLESIQTKGSDKILRLRERLAYIRKCKQQLSQMNTDDIKRIESNLLDNNQETKLISNQIDAKSNILAAINEHIENSTREYEHTNSEINALRLLKNYETNDIKVLHITKKFLHKYTKLKFLGMEGKQTTYKFDDTFIVKFDFEHLQKNLGISIQKRQDTVAANQIKNKFLLDHVSLQLVSFINTGSIVEQFRLFSELWNGLKALDREIYKISLGCPITWDYNNDTIHFSYVYCNFENDYKLNVNCGLRVRDILDFTKLIKVELEVLRGTSLTKTVILDDLEKDMYRSGVVSRSTFEKLLARIGIA